MFETSISNHKHIEVGKRIALTLDGALQNAAISFHRKSSICSYRPNVLYAIGNVEELMHGEDTCRQTFGRVLIVESRRYGEMSAHAYTDACYLLLVGLDPFSKLFADFVELQK